MPSGRSPSPALQAHLKAIAPIGGFTRSAMYDGRDMTAKAREAFRSSFERLVDPDRTLDPVERGRRAAAARKAFYQRLAFRSAQARRKKAGRVRASDFASDAAERPDTGSATHE